MRNQISASYPSLIRSSGRPEMLFSKEIDLLRTGAAVIPVLDDLNVASAKYQVWQMANGQVEAYGSEFIEKRQAEFARDYSLYVAHQLSEVRAAIESGATRPKTFDEVLVMFEARIPAIIREVLRKRIAVSEVAAMHSRPDVFPATRSTVRANLYLWSIVWLNDTGASHDKSDDYRHIVEASYSDVFVTGDRRLAQTVHRIHPSLDVLTWDDIHAT